MSRYIGERDTTVILSAANHWQQNCLEKDGSVFSDNAVVWTLLHFQDLEEYFINTPDGSSNSFYEKLENQLDSASDLVKQLAAEMLWVMFLCSSNLTTKKKRQGIKTVWEFSDSKLPENLSWLNDETLMGIGSSGTGYNTLRWKEFAYFIRLMIAFKKLDKVRQKGLLADGWQMAQWMEQIPENNSRQFRHMFLFLLFPDRFERIFGGTDRREIIKAFSGMSASKINGLTAFEIDEHLSDIRKAQAESLDQEELDFYLPPLHDLWRPARNVSWLFTWNPDFFPWGTLKEDRDKTFKGEAVVIPWNCSSNKIMEGDKAFLTRVGTEPRGIFAVGNVVVEPYEDTHWDEQKALKGETTNFVKIEFSRIHNPLSGDPIVTADDLKSITIDNQKWAPQNSGIIIKPRSAGLLQKRWNQLIKHQNTPAPVKVFEPCNHIFYGPPGTGKTFQMNQLVKEQYQSNNKSINKEAWLIQQLLDARWFDAIAAALYHLGGKAKVGIIAEHEYIRLKARAMGRTKNITQTIWATLQQHTKEDSQTVQYKNRQAPYAFDKDERSVWFLTNDWEEECADTQKFAKNLEKGPEKELHQDRYEFITFHQAYGYEDFIEGIRPILDNEIGELAYEVVPGVFRRIAQKAKADPEQRYALFIDEINRGNIAKIFGELITLIDIDKRAEYDDEGRLLSGMELTLPYSGDRFGVPKNIDIYGTMNTADRSIALLDTALRRRFHFKELRPKSSLLRGSSVDGSIEDGEGGLVDLRALLDAINGRIRFLLNRDMTIGHAYFYRVRNFNHLKEVFLNQLIPLLQEYFYEDWHRIQLVFRDVGPSGEKLEPQIICHQKIKEQEILGFDHDDYEDLVEYTVVRRDEITPSAIRKIYEDVS